MPKDINGNEIKPLSGFLNADGTPIEQTNEQPTTGGQEPGGFSSGNEPTITPESTGTELKPVEAPTPTEVQLPEQKQRVYTDTGYIDMNAQDYQNYLADKAKRKSEAGTSAQEGNLTPEQKALQTQQEKTTTITPQGTTTVLKETPKVVDKTARNNEIVANLNEGYKNDPTVQQAINSGNFELFKSKYNMQDPEEARIVEAFYQAHQPKDTQSFYNILKLGQQIQNKDTLLNSDYIKAKAKYDLFTKFNSMDSNSLLSELKNNNINQELDQELSQNPNYIKAKDDFSNFKKISEINKQGQSNIGAISGKTTEPTKITEKLTDQYSGGKTTEELISFRDYMGKNDPTLVKQVSELNTKEAELKKLTDARDDRLKQIQKQYPGLDIGSAVLLANRQNEAINEQIKSMSYDLDRLEADIKFRRELLEKDYDNEKDRKELEEKRAYEKSLLQEQRTYDQKVADDKLKQEFDYTYGDLTSTDPNVQRVAGERIATAIQKQYEGMPFRRDISTMGADIVKEINSGKSIDTITTEITNAIQSSPYFANWKANNKALATPEVKYDFTTFDNKLVRTDSSGNAEIIATGTPKASDIKKWEKVGDFYQSPIDGQLYSEADIKQAKLADNSYLNAPVGTNVGVECGQYARTATGLTATPGGNSLTERKAQFSDSTPTPGGLVLFSGGGYNPTYGHIAVVTGVNTDGTINVKESNYRGDNKVTERKNVPLTYVSGFYNNTPLAGGLEKVSKESTKEITTLRKEFNALPEVKNYRTAKENFNKIVTSAQKESPAGDMSLIFAYMKTLDPTSTVREGEFATAQNSGGIPDQIKNYYNKAIDGERLQPSQRADFVSTARKLMEGYLNTYNTRLSDYQTYITEGGRKEDIGKVEQIITPKGKISYNDGTYFEYDGQGNYRYYGKDKKLSSWTKEGSPIGQSKSTGKKEVTPQTSDYLKSLGY